MSAPTLSWPAVFGGLLVAGAAGFGLAQLGRGPFPAPEAEPAEAHAAETGRIKVEAANLALMQIGIETAATSPFSAGVEAAGRVVASPQGEARVSAQAAGAVTRLYKRLGDPVRAGETLAEVASREASGLAADRSVAESRAALARQMLEREQRLFGQRVTPRQDLEKAQAELAAAEAELRRARGAASAAQLAGDGRSLLVVSPIAGRVTASAAALGAYVQPETELFRVADPSQAQVEAAVSPADAARIRPGDAARVTSSAGAALTARVRAVTPTLDADTRSATVVLTLDPGSAAIPGDAVRVQIAPAAAGPSTVVIPEEAVQRVEGREVVFVRTADGFRAQPIIVSARGGGRAAIASGLAAGAVVATKNAFLLKAELTKGAGGHDE